MCLLTRPPFNPLDVCPYHTPRVKGGGDLTVRANEVAMRAAHQLLDGDWAKEIMALPANRNNKKGLNPATLMAAVDVLVDSGRPQEAREILKVRTDMTVVALAAAALINYSGHMCQHA